RAEVDRLVEVRGQWRVEPVENPAVERVGDPEARSERDQRDDQPRAELAEGLDQRGLFAVAKAPREPAHRRYGVGGGGSSAERAGSSAFSSSEPPVIESLNSR